jgi:hypothetical protein
MMTESALKRIEEKILRDGSLTEEKKAELLNLLATMKPETVKTYKVQAEHSPYTADRSEHPVYAAIRNRHRNQRF